ncbi:flagellar motor switch protein FliG [Erythrobacter sanguineus]|jgi:flagellar motor switch protein FliG|uniref:Flagellar motor switch protein FliG n=1 Tax=Erythrobacter sanguineus TaxID=198312 RepID=A0A1M7SY45_9SPHN|nr:flagellar motor switch protein FliG [Erythrobacter sanguineus]MCR9179358.1 flagellar motor switch protein FliG [Erythrobacteraceae bacterium]SHN63407.1 flagellar motor switch protein FliG [Erythrobacter sanguineus]
MSIDLALDDAAAAAAPANLLNRIDRAAVFLMLLDDEEASGILGRLAPEELEQLGAAMMALGEIDQSRMVEALADFVQEAAREILPQRGRNDRVRTLLDKALGPVRADSMMQRIEPEARPRSLEMARWLVPAVLIRLIEDEHPQVIAALLLLIEPEPAAEVLSALPHELQTMVVERVAKSGPVSPRAIGTIDTLLTQRITATFGAAALALGGPREAANLINLAAGDLRDTVLPAIAERDSLLATRIEEELFTFEMLFALDPMSMGRLLRDVDSEKLVDALKGLKEPDRAPFFAAMSSRAADGVKDEIELRGRLAKSDVAAAQKAIVEVARGLADAGEIVIGSGDGEFV